MAESANAKSQNLQKYGIPIYGAGWVPCDHVRSKIKIEEDKQEHQSGSKDEPVTDKSDEISSDSYKYYVVLAGGGGEGRSGIPNAVVLSHFDFTSNSLSYQPVAELRTDSDLPYRMVVHPRGDGIICAMQKSCRLFEWDEVEDPEVHKLGVKSAKVLSQLDNVGQQLALAFNSEGSTFAAGSEDGSLRVFKWPSMENILNESQAHASVKDLSFSPDGKFLVSLGRPGPGRVWDVTSSTAVASLPKENDEVFVSCRFSLVNDDQNSVLYIAAITDKGGSIVTWNTNLWKRIRSKHVVHAPISSFNFSANGKFLAIGTAEGDISIIDASGMKVQTIVKKAHLGIVTALAFSHDSRALVSASMDSSVRVTIIEDKKKSGGLNFWIIIFFILLAMAAYMLKDKGIIP